MISGKFSRRIFLVLAGIALLLTSCASTMTTEPDTVIFLVRHAEKVKDGSRDPALSAEGEMRSQVLAERLVDENIGTIHSTDYIRTRDTAAPLAEKLGQEVKLYDPRALSAFAGELRAEGGRHLVVGHSNTTPSLVGLLGGDPGTPIDEPGEYDRLYIVTITSDGSASSALQRYGTLYQVK